MSLWLSAAHRVAGSARGQVAAEVKRQSANATRAAAASVIDFWTGAAVRPPAPPAARKNTQGKRRRA